MNRRNYKRILSGTVLTLCLMLGSHLYAQERPSAEARAQALTDNMARHMNIKDCNRLDQIQAVNLRAARAMDSLSDASHLNSAVLAREGKRIDQQHDQALEYVLDIKEWAVYIRYKRQMVYAEGNQR